MHKLIKQIENKRNIKLDDTQKDVLSNLISFCKDPNKKSICVCGSAGTGKTTMIQWVLDIFDVTTIVCTPTHKSLRVLENKLDCNTCEYATLHSFLHLQPSLNILEFDAKDMQFVSGYEKYYKVYDLVIIDECSMINDQLYHFLLQLQKQCHFKLMFFGDPAQLAPVKQTASKVFQHNSLWLKNIYRQKESCLYPILEKLRTRPIYRFTEQSDEFSDIIICNDIKTMLQQYSYLFKFASDTNNINCAKIISYTNNRISAINKKLRSYIYSDDSEYHIGEPLTGYDTIVQNGKIIIENSSDYFVEKITPIKFRDLSAYQLQLCNITEPIIVLSRNNSESNFAKLTCELEQLRCKAVETKMAKYWEKFFVLYNSFASPIDLMIGTRTIKKKSIDYGYCISAHKSQGSEYQFVLIDMENLWRCTDKVTLRQLQYVACSRTKSNIIIYQTNE